MTTHEPASSNTRALLTWSAERFYWTLLDVPAGRSGARAFTSAHAFPLPPGLRIAMQDDVPVPMETLHAVGIGLSSIAGSTPKILAIAASREDLADALSTDAVSLTPGSIPALAHSVEQVTPGQLNMLIGEFEPRATRRARTMRHLLSMAAVLAAAGLLGIGLNRRAEHAEALAIAAKSHAATLLTQLTNGSPAKDREGLQRTLAYTRALRTAMHDPEATTNAMPALVSALKTWPLSATATPQSLGVSGNDGGLATISVSVEGDPAEFLHHVTPPEGWTLDEPRLNASGSVTRVVLTLRPAKDGHHANRTTHAEGTP